MDYKAAIDYLYTAAPLFQHIGAGAYKEGLGTTHILDAHYGHPHRRYATIHVAGTNGKGSCAHTLAAILQSAGLRVGLYTSPHLVDFRERIRVNGQKISRERVAAFVETERSFFEPLHPSFFELTTALAFKYFAEEGVDIAVIEVGLGGRLDCTNIISPLVSIITNISLDHTQFLGATPAAIAAEKAGIIKSGIPVIVGETTAETRPVFAARAAETGAPIWFAEDEDVLRHSRQGDDDLMHYLSADWGELRGELSGSCQEKNAATVLTALRQLRTRIPVEITATHVAEGFARVTRLTGLSGRWQILSARPFTVCDTGHNAGGWAYLGPRLAQLPCRRLHVVFGMAGDKDVNTVLRMLPREATFYFTQASVKRAMPAAELTAAAQREGLEGRPYASVAQAFAAAQAAATPDDAIFVGGSSFVVADLLTALSGEDD